MASYVAAPLAETVHDDSRTGFPNFDDFAKYLEEAAPGVKPDSLR